MKKESTEWEKIFANERSYIQNIKAALQLNMQNPKPDFKMIRKKKKKKRGGSRHGAVVNESD